ncbi:MAG: hypothetical protein SVR08_16615, partial [Spirochaetota bacterium]|nr:hypothetical protein [Spirochaetota bacterium]
MKKKETRKRFSFLLFFITSLLLLLFSAGVSIGYFYYVGKSRIKEIEDYTRDYSITLADAFTNVAELSYNRRNYSKLKILFQEKINKNIIDEAFFVLADGKIIAHTDKKTTKSLKGNIATDEFAYNLDLILYPLRIKSKQAQFFDYHIFNKEIPFSKDFKRIIKTYLYKKIDIV